MMKLSLEYPDVAVGLFTPGPTRTGFGGEKLDWDSIPGANDVEEVVAGLVREFEGVGLEDGGEEEEQVNASLRAKDWSGRVIDW